ncbi:MAG: hypothetical protein A2V59_04875 [Armatimonadetes bacterium RBG_19FT_COMBO_69_19]|nr:MAG: hypothetical protein A2V59_04875 [Armatimonadetes bacterium RBG_19FT_COMBO_69_19]
MFKPEMIRDHWTTVQPKLREIWPNLSEQDVQVINGDAELLVTKVREKYNSISRDEIFSKLATYLPVQPVTSVR